MGLRVTACRSACVLPAHPFSRSLPGKVPAYLYHVWRNKCKTRRQKALFLGCLVVFLTAPIPINRRIARLPLWDRYVFKSM